MVQACLKFPILSNPSTAKKHSVQNLFKPSHPPQRTEGILSLPPRRAAAWGSFNNTVRGLSLLLSSDITGSLNLRLFLPSLSDDCYLRVEFVSLTHRCITWSQQLINEILQDGKEGQTVDWKTNQANFSLSLDCYKIKKLDCNPVKLLLSCGAGCLWDLPYYRPHSLHPSAVCGAPEVDRGCEHTDSTRVRKGTPNVGCQRWQATVFWGPRTLLCASVLPCAIYIPFCYLWRIPRTLTWPLS